jgi:membrane fusion protein, copper/silver efflux system
MKKIYYAVIILALIAGSFWAGSWYNQRETAKVIPPGIKSTTHAHSGPDTDTVIDTKFGTSSLPPGTVKISPSKQQTIGIRLGVVEKTSALHTLRILGRVAPDETRVYRINAAVDGWITETPFNTVGSLVKKDERLASFYSPEFLGAQQAYLYALGAMDRYQATGKETPSQIELTKVNIQQYKDSLKNQGMSDLQIEEIAKARQYTEKIHIISPADGFILVRNVSPGERFEKGKELYRIADLSRVWILADIYENEAQYLQPGKSVRASLPHQKKTLQAKVSNVLPQFDPATRTLKVRLEADNPGYMLRPDMFVDVELPVTLPPTISVPADAVLDSGLKKTVFVDLGNGYFEPREVETGWRIGNQVEIVKGLKAGERIVVSGNFMIDSESRLELAASGMYGTLSKDPVCGVDVSISKAEKAGRKSIYQGKTYYFSSDECKEKFEKNPERYVKK